MKANLIISNPSFNARATIREGDPRWEYGVPSSKNANMAWLQHMLYHLMEDGEMAIILPPGTLTQIKFHQKEIRTKLVEQGLVDAIVTLPKRMFDATDTCACIWFLSRKKTERILLVDSTKNFQAENIIEAFRAFCAGKTPNEPEFCTVATHEQITANDYSLHPAQYLQKQETSILSCQENVYQLKDLLDIKYPRQPIDMSGGKFPVYSSAGAKRHTNEPKQHGPALIIGRKGNIGSVFLKNGAFSVAETAYCAFPKRTDIPLEYLYYKLKNMDFSHLNTGNGRPNLSLKMLNNISISVNADDFGLAKFMQKLEQKCDQNRKLVDILKQYILQVYHRFFADRNFDMIPLGELFRVTNGHTPHSTGHLPWFDTSDLNEPYLFHSSRMVDGSEALRWEIPADTIVLCYKLTHMGDVAITTEPCMTNEAIAAFRTERKWMNPYLYCFLQEYRYDSLGSNSSFGKSARLTAIRKIEMPLPPDAQLQAFVGSVQPFFDEMRTLLRENQHAEQTVNDFMNLL